MSQILSPDELSLRIKHLVRCCKTYQRIISQIGFSEMGMTSIIWNLWCDARRMHMITIDAIAATLLGAPLGGDLKGVSDLDENHPFHLIYDKYKRHFRSIVQIEPLTMNLLSVLKECEALYQNALEHLCVPDKFEILSRSIEAIHLARLKIVGGSEITPHQLNANVLVMALSLTFLPILRKHFEGANLQEKLPIHGLRPASPAVSHGSKDFSLHPSQVGADSPQHSPRPIPLSPLTKFGDADGGAAPASPPSSPLGAPIEIESQHQNVRENASDFFLCLAHETGIILGKKFPFGTDALFAFPCKRQLPTQIQQIRAQLLRSLAQIYPNYDFGSSRPYKDCNQYPSLVATFYTAEMIMVHEWSHYRRLKRSTSASHRYIPRLTMEDDFESLKDHLGSLTHPKAIQRLQTMRAEPSWYEAEELEGLEEYRAIAAATRSENALRHALGITKRTSHDYADCVRLEAFDLEYSPICLNLEFVDPM